jgi:hypothetical protein
MSMIKLNPDLIYFTHSKIRNQFSGCGKLLSQTLSDLRFNPQMIENIPKIKVVYIPNRNMYLSLNNRRLWIYKKLYQEGLIKEITVSLLVDYNNKNFNKNDYSLQAKLTK